MSLRSLKPTVIQPRTDRPKLAIPETELMGAVGNRSLRTALCPFSRATGSFTVLLNFVFRISHWLFVSLGQLSVSLFHHFRICSFRQNGKHVRLV